MHAIYAFIYVSCVLLGLACSPDELIEPKEDPLVQELADVLREWTVVWKRLYAVSNAQALWACAGYVGVDNLYGCVLAVWA